MPSKFKKRGRTTELTVIGLQRKRRKTEKISLQPFAKLHISKKKKKILSWLCSKETCDSALSSNQAIGPGEISETLSDALLDECVNIVERENC